ncbi:MAG: hypothetical protein NC218_05520 [Acetobacter sp.]|nr:hypothetical protein [Acetobacter sp.]
MFLPDAVLKYGEIMMWQQCLNKFNLKEIFWQKLPYIAVVLELSIAAVFYALVSVYLPTQNGDNIEHIHSSFMIALGEVPYKDFFQHHNPLLWYLFAPLTKLFAYDSTIVEVVCFISFLVFLKSLVYVYYICSEFLCDKLWGVMAAAAVAVPGYKLYAIDFRPDNYMIFCLMGGIYYLFSHLRDKKQWQLSVAFLWFMLSFLFAQKALFPLGCLGVCVLYFWYEKSIETKMLFKALLVPVIGGLGFLFYLYHYDMISLYYICNYTFNLNLVKGFDFNRIINFSTVILIWVCLGWIGALAASVQGNKYWRVLAFLFVVEFIQRRFYFSPYLYYYWLLVYLAVLSGIPFVAKLDAKHNVVRFVFLIVLYYFLGKAIIYFGNIYKSRDDRPYLPDYVARQITPCDYVFNGDGYMYNLFGKDPAYYWQLIGQLDVIGEKTGIRPRPDMNKLIEDVKPKFVYGRSYFNKFSRESGRLEIVHYINPDIINRYYMPAGFGNVYRLKAEYDERRCVKDLKSGKWGYQD